MKEYDIKLQDFTLDEFRKFVTEIPSSRDTISRRVADISNAMKIRTNDAIRNSEPGYSLQLDESIDKDSKCQLAIFARYFFSCFKV